MPQREDILRELTFKGECDDTAHRAFYTLCGDKASDGPKPGKSGVTPEEAAWLHRISRGFAELVQILEARGALGENEIDEVLLRVAGY
jgi:hypothetical protein